MIIDLTQINDKMEVDQQIVIDEELLQDSQIKALKGVRAKGIIYFDATDELNIDLLLNGTMIIEDSYSLNDVNYHFEIKIEEAFNEEEQEMLKFTKNSENLLDITAILWQNIVLEVPISYSSKKELPSTSGDGWELVNEDNKKVDPRLAKLKLLLEEDERKE